MKHFIQKHLSDLSSRWVRLVLLLLNPHIKLPYFLAYVSAVQNNQNRRTNTGAVKFFYTMIVAKILHFLYLGFVSPCTAADNVIHYNALTLLTSKRQINKLGAFFLTFDLYCVRGMLSAANCRLLLLLKKILVSRSGGCTFFYLEPVDSRRQIYCDQVRRYCLATFNAFLSPTVIIGKITKGEWGGRIYTLRFVSYFSHRFYEPPVLSVLYVKIL